MKIKRIAPSPFIKDVLLTTVTSGLTILSTLIVMRLLAQGLGTDGFGAYSLARRFLAVVSPFSTFAIGVGLARFIAISKDNTERDGYLLSGLLIGVIPSFIVLVFGLIFKDRLTVLIFRYDVYASLFGATLFMIVGYSFYNVLYSYYRGLGKMVKANLWQLAVIAVGPLAITFKYAISKELDLIVFLMGVCFLSSSLPLIFYSLKAIFQNKQSLEIKPYLKELFNYSLPRVPGGLALTGIFSIGPFLATYFGSLKDAGYLVVGLSVFSVIDNAVIAFGIVALPKVTHLFKEGRGDFLEKRVTDIVSMILHMGMFA
ncbi:MAG: lipopolysaccharide biosynthesis protein, partial [Thermodesulfovibrionales bacterium]|nr:lipopolysaccharide biosynthesis protein [Thermodesulfovibrionales bacterium]